MVVVGRVSRPLDFEWFGLGLGFMSYFGSPILANCYVKHNAFTRK